jgi:hypothetical protein
MDKNKGKDPEKTAHLLDTSDLLDYVKKNPFPVKEDPEVLETIEETTSETNHGVEDIVSIPDKTVRDLKIDRKMLIVKKDEDVEIDTEGEDKSGDGHMTIFLKGSIVKHEELTDARKAELKKKKAQRKANFEKLQENDK